MSSGAGEDENFSWFGKLFPFLLVIALHVAVSSVSVLFASHLLQIKLLVRAYIRVLHILVSPLNLCLLFLLVCE